MGVLKEVTPLAPLIVKSPPVSVPSPTDAENLFDEEPIAPRARRGMKPPLKRGRTENDEQQSAKTKKAKEEKSAIKRTRKSASIKKKRKAVPKQRRLPVDSDSEVEPESEEEEEIVELMVDSEEEEIHMQLEDDSEDEIPFRKPRDKKEKSAPKVKQPPRKKAKVEPEVASEPEENFMEVDPLPPPEEAPKPTRKAKAAARLSLARPSPPEIEREVEPSVQAQQAAEAKKDHKLEKMLDAFRALKERYTTVKAERDELKASAVALQGEKSQVAVERARILELENNIAEMSEQLKAAVDDSNSAKVELKEWKKKGAPKAPTPQGPTKKEEKLRLRKERLQQQVERLEAMNLSLVRSNEQLGQMCSELKDSNVTLAEERKKAQNALDELQDAAPAEATPSELARALLCGFGGVLSLTRESEDDKCMYLTCSNVNDPERRILFELVEAGHGLYSYTPIRMDGFSQDELVPDFILNDIFFKKKFLPVFLSKLIVEVGKDDDQ